MNGKVSVWVVTTGLAMLASSSALGGFIGGVERFDGTVRDTTTWSLWEKDPGQVFAQNYMVRLDGYDYSPRVISRAKYVTLSEQIGVGQMCRAKVTYNEMMDSFGTGGLMLTADTTLQDGYLDSSFLSLFNLSSGWGNCISAGYKDNWGAGPITASQHPVGSTYIYEIARLSSTSAMYSVYSGASVVGTPQILTFEGVPDDLYIAVYALQGDFSFDDVTILPAPATTGLLLMAALGLLRRKSRRNT